MPTAADVALFAAATDDVVALAHGDLLAWWQGLDLRDVDSAVTALEEFMAELVAAYGSVAATLGADFYEELREQAAAPGSFRAEPAEPVPAEQARATARWAVAPLFGGDGPRAALEHVAGSVQRLVQQPARETITLNVARDPARPGWARVPRVGGCAFCRMLASRGAVYGSEQAAGGMRAFHDHCKCTTAPVWQGQPLPYDAADLERQYRQARERAGSGSTKKILAQMRQDQGVS